jgi:tRNA-splicing ligase RtcB
MDLALFERKTDFEWHIRPFGRMQVPGVIFASETLLRAMDAKVYEQVCNVAMLPGIVGASWAMPDAHWGYGFAIGGVAAFDADAGGVVSAGGVGFDISCGVRTLHTGLGIEDIHRIGDIGAVKARLADALYRTIPAGMGSTGAIRLDAAEMDAMLLGGARWAVGRGFGNEADLERIEEGGCMRGAEPSQVSGQARKRQRDEMGTLGSGNQYLEVQLLTDVYAPDTAAAFGVKQGDIVVSIHCGSRGLGHQIGTEFLKRMVIAAPGYGITLPDRELACAPVNSPLGQDYLGAMRAAINCALANRQILTHLTRSVFAQIFGKPLPQARLPLLYDVSHNTCKVEEHQVDGRVKQLYVHRKGATRAFGPGHADLPRELRDAGQPVLIGGSMGTASYILAGTGEGMQLAFGSACHGAGRAMSRHQALRNWGGRKVVDDLAGRGILIRSPSLRGVAEEAPGAYKDVSAVVDAADHAGLARKVARLVPLICIKG